MPKFCANVTVTRTYELEFEAKDKEEAQDIAEHDYDSFFRPELKGRDEFVEVDFLEELDA